jgi:hypothetical protein
MCYVCPLFGTFLANAVNQKAIVCVGAKMLVKCNYRERVFYTSKISITEKKHNNEKSALKVLIKMT